MKKITLTLLSLMLSIQLVAQDDNSAALGFIFGMSQQTVKAKMLKDRGERPRDESTDSNTLIYLNSEFAGEKAKAIMFQFIDDVMYALSISTTPSHENQVFRGYEKMRDLLNKKYGEPTLIIEEYTLPYYKGDGYELTAVRTDNTSIFTIWQYPTFSLENRVTVYITASESVMTIYTNQHLEKIVNKRKERNALKDL